MAALRMQDRDDEELSGSEAAPTEGGAQVFRFSRRTVAARRRASWRYAELLRLAGFRRRFDVEMDEAVWAVAFSATLSAATRGFYALSKTDRRFWPGLDLKELGEAMRKAGFGRLDLFGADGNRLATAMHKVEAAQRFSREREARGDKIGRVLGLTAEERAFCTIRTMTAIDETPEERAMRAAEGKRRADQQRQRARRAGKHQPRAEWEAGSLAKARPWEAEGISRATWFRRQSKVPLERTATRATDQSQAFDKRAASPATDPSQLPDFELATSATHQSHTTDFAAATYATDQCQSGETGVSRTNIYPIGGATDPSHAERAASLDRLGHRLLLALRRDLREARRIGDATTAVALSDIAGRLTAGAD